jgi:uncharacterized protein YggE
MKLIHTSTMLMATALLLLPQNSNAGEANSIKASATGTVFVDADVAYIDVMVKHTAETPKAARDGNQKAVDKLYKALRKVGIQSKHVVAKPIDLIVYRPQDTRYMDGLAPKLPQQHETAIRVIRIKISGIKAPALKKVWKVVDAVVAAGGEPVRDTRGYYSVNQSIPSFITLSLADPSKATKAAISKAFKNAKAEALHAAQLNGVKLKGLLSAKVGQPIFQMVLRGNQIHMTQRMDDDSFQLGRLKFSVTVDATYQIGS